MRPERHRLEIRQDATVMDDMDPAAQVANHTNWQGLRQDIGRVAPSARQAGPVCTHECRTWMYHQRLASGVVDHSLVVRHQSRLAPNPKIGQPTPGESPQRPSPQRTARSPQLLSATTFCLRDQKRNSAIVHKHAAAHRPPALLARGPVRISVRIQAAS